MGIGIVVDSGCDVPVDVVKKYDIKVVPLRIIINGKEYEEGEISEDFLFEHIDEEVKTSLPISDRIINTFKELLKQGKNEIITLNLSSGLSGTFNLFKMISKDFMNENKDVKIINIDTLNISIGSGLVVLKTAEYIEEGKKIDEIAKLIEKDVKKSKVFFVIPTLKYLVKGGRIGKVSATIGEFLKVKPIISANEEGIYYTVCKARGLNKAFKKVFEEFSRFVGEKKFLAGIYISGSEKKIKDVQDELKERIEKMKNSQRVFEGKISSTLAVHTGPGLLGIGALILD
ncbi:MAG: DegV family protein [Thermotogae bacterium]|nr:DegV family protein [Thermotogota bacterium]